MNSTMPAINAMGASSTSIFSGIFTKFWAVMVIIFVLFIAIVIYYKTIGYYLEFGWKRIYKMIVGGDSVDIEIGGENGIEAEIKPMAMPPPNLHLSVRSNRLRNRVRKYLM